MKRWFTWAKVCTIPLAIAICPSGAHAEKTEERASYSVTIAGLPAAQLAIAIRRDGTAYAAAMQARSSGLAGMFANFTVDSSVRGVESEGRWRPNHYKSDSDGYRGGRGAEIDYQSNVPKVVRLSSGDDPTAPKVDPLRQKGAIDPLSAMLSVLTDVPADRFCQQRARIFDGHRVAEMALSGPIEGNRCAGFYQRLEGYPPEELAKRDRFTFTADYIVLPNGKMRLTELRLDSLFGLAHVSRNAD